MDKPNIRVYYNILDIKQFKIKPLYDFFFKLLVISAADKLRAR